MPWVILLVNSMFLGFCMFCPDPGIRECKKHCDWGSQVVLWMDVEFVIVLKKGSNTNFCIFLQLDRSFLAAVALNVQLSANRGKHSLERSADVQTGPSADSVSLRPLPPQRWMLAWPSNMYGQTRLVQPPGGHCYKSPFQNLSSQWLPTFDKP